MSIEENIIQKLIIGVGEDQVKEFFQRVCDDFRSDEKDENHCLKEDYKKDFGAIKSLGLIDFGITERLLVCVTKLDISLTENSSKKKQYEVSRQVLRAKGADGGLFVFYDKKGKFRFSFVRRYATGLKREFTTFKRYSFYVDPSLSNKTFIQQMKKGSFTGLDKIQEVFSLESVTKKFYDEFSPQFDELANSVQGVSNKDARKDFALLFVIRIIFIGFVQKKGWLKQQDFIQRYWKEYKAGKHNTDSFYTKWLEPLFFEALNSPPGHKVKYGNNPFSVETEELLQMAPFLNGELFKPHAGIDNRGVAFIPDEHISKFIEFLFQYNFTIEENTNIDEELELSPEFLGIIFERLVNKADGAVYTPRTEVDLMCRLSLVKWLEKNTKCPMDELLHLFFREGGHGQEYDDDQKYGSFSTNQIRELHDKLSGITVCDPAAGSGAFPVGMMQVLVDIFTIMQEKQPTWPADLLKPSVFERKKAIIANSLYGAEVKHWAVWINQLRLWLSLFIDMPDDYKLSLEPLLPSLNFKIRCGDSLVQRIGGKIFPVRGHAELPASLKGEITKLKGMKIAFFNNDRTVTAHDIKNKEYTVFKKILETQLDDAKLKLTHASGAKPKQADMFGNDAPEQQSLPLNVQKISELKSTIQELEEELRALKQDHPFIWGIEFAEIFYERDGFDIVIGNPPYVASGNISDPNESSSDKEYKEALKEVLSIDYPEYFKDKKRINGRSDLFTYFYLHSLAMLNQRGIHSFICGNVWLDAEQGLWVQEFLSSHVKIHMIIDNHSKKSFDNADVNTVITIFDAPTNSPKKYNWGESLIKFVSFKTTFEQAIITENIAYIEKCYLPTQQGLIWVYPISHDSLINENFTNVEKKKNFFREYVGEKWGGKYLRSPNIFLNIINRNKDHILRICDSNFVSLQGYVHDNNIGEKYPKTLFIKTIKEMDKVLLTNEDCYQFGVSEVGDNRLKAPLLIARTYGENSIVLLNSCGAVGKEFYRVFVKDEYCSPLTLAIYLNSSFFLLQRELMGLVGLGGGALKFSVYDIGKIYLLDKMPSFPEEVSKRFLERKVFSPIIECGIDPESFTPIEEQQPNPLPDRKALDDIIFDALGLTEDERKDVYRAVCRLVWNRISKAKNV